jgi:hypothetical protein
MAIYVGGPCDGQQAGPSYYAQRVCGGVTYTVGEDGNYHTGAQTPTGSFGIAGVHSAQRAWANMNRALGPDTHRMIQRLNRAAKKMRRAAN